MNKNKKRTDVQQKEQSPHLNGESAANEGAVGVDTFDEGLETRTDRNKSKRYDQRRTYHENSPAFENQSVSYRGRHNDNRWSKNRKKNEEKVLAEPGDVKGENYNLNDESALTVGAICVENLDQKVETKTDENRNKSSKVKHQSKRRGTKPKDVNLRSKLTDQLMRGSQECMVCLDKVRQQQATWDCTNCYQVLA